MIYSDWHIHSENSYDASLSLEAIAQGAITQKLRFVGITDHANYNDESFLGNLRASAKSVKELQKKYPFMVLGVELTPIAKPEFDYIAKTGTLEGFVYPISDKPYDMELSATKDELKALGVRYAVCASHWQVNVPKEMRDPFDMDACIKEWYRQQLWLACDERTTILGHPWNNIKGLWYQDFSVIPHSMNMDIAAALKENGKYAECNVCFFRSQKSGEKFRYQYAEFLRELFEMGIPITYGSDRHKVYEDLRWQAEKYLAAAGFKDDDFSELDEKDLW